LHIYTKRSNSQRRFRENIEKSEATYLKEYPKSCRPEVYAEHFSAVELNANLYRLLNPQAFETWSKSSWVAPQREDPSI